MVGDNLERFCKLFLHLLYFVIYTASGFILSLGGRISTHQEKNELEDSEMLTDKHISAVNYNFT